MKRPIYLDNAAGTPVDPRVEKVMRPYFLRAFGNPGSLHSFGQEAIAAVDRSRETIARLIGADFREVVFTGSATEANNLALRGALKAWRSDPAHKGVVPRVIVSAIEHESVLETARDLASEGVEILYAPVNGEGAVDPQWIADAVSGDERTVIVSVMYVNNEIGTVEPIPAIADAVHTARKKARWPLFHTDAVQAFQFFECDVRKSGVDMMTLSAHKICGPKGVGALYIREGTPCAPIVTGGGQEFGLRSGTENVPLIAGFAKAAELAAAMRTKEAARVAALRDYCIEEIKKTLRSAVVVNGPQAIAGAAPHIVNVSIPGKTAEDLVMRLDLAGICVSSGSACRARAIQPSYVVRALSGGTRADGTDGNDAGARARSSIRISFGRTTAKSDIDRFIAAMKLFQNKVSTIS